MRRLYVMSLTVGAVLAATAMGCGGGGGSGTAEQGQTMDQEKAAEPDETTGDMATQETTDKWIEIDATCTPDSIDFHTHHGAQVKWKNNTPFTVILTFPTGVINGPISIDPGKVGGGKINESADMDVRHEYRIDGCEEPATTTPGIIIDPPGDN